MASIYLALLFIRLYSSMRDYLSLLHENMKKTLKTSCWSCDRSWKGQLTRLDDIPGSLPALQGLIIELSLWGAMGILQFQILRQENTISLSVTERSGC